MVTSDGFFLFDPIESADSIGNGRTLTGGFEAVVGYSWLGDVFLRERVGSGRFGVLFTYDPEFVPLMLDSEKEFDEYLRAEVIVRTVLRLPLIEEIISLSRPLVMGEAFIPKPFPFLGGDGSAKSYGICKIWTLLDMLGEFQGFW